ncbi:MAG: hypothetical protein IGS39_13390 [Calothrix sp. C42_A2020_038]|nr:hypothetical protein [Calothrix sp. C42_A2020_038]
MKQLVNGEKVAKESSKRQGVSRENFLGEYHNQRLTSIQTQWNADLTKLGIQNPHVCWKCPQAIQSCLTFHVMWKNQCRT